MTLSKEETFNKMTAIWEKLERYKQIVSIVDNRIVNAYTLTVGDWKITKQIYPTGTIEYVIMNADLGAYGTIYKSKDGVNGLVDIFENFFKYVEEHETFMNEQNDFIEDGLFMYKALKSLGFTRAYFNIEGYTIRVLKTTENYLVEVAKGEFGRTKRSVENFMLNAFGFCSVYKDGNIVYRLYVGKDMVDELRNVLELFYFAIISGIEEYLVHAEYE